MSIKPLINALFQLSGSRAMPSGTVVSQQTLNAGSNIVISPCNGYAWLHASESEQSNAYASLESSGMTHLHQSPSSTHSYDCHIPVRKGSQIKAYISNFTGEKRLTFISTVGGG